MLNMWRASFDYLEPVFRLSQTEADETRGLVILVQCYHLPRGKTKNIMKCLPIAFSKPCKLVQKGLSNQYHMIGGSGSSLATQTTT